VFARNNSKHGTNSECIFRIDQDGVHCVIPYMTKRLIVTEQEEDFKFFLLNKMIDEEAIPESKMKRDILDLTLGCFILSLKVPGTNKVEALVLHRFQKSISVMISREGIYNLHLRYLTKE
jgi:hypothetical protein